MLGDSVVGVSHCVDPRGGRVTRGTWAIAAVGLASLLAATIAFGASVRAAARDAAAIEHRARVLHRPAYTLRPHRASELAGGVMFGGLALGISALAIALLRARGEREDPRYRIGTAPGVEQPVLGAPSESFPLVGPSGDVLVFNYAPGIEGELIAGGEATPLSELAAAGRALPSVTAPGALEIPIPPAAEIRARVGGVTFRVSSVERPEPWAPAPAIDRRAAWYVAGSLAAHLGILHLLPRADLDEVFLDGIIVCPGPIEPYEPPEPDGEQACVLVGCICLSEFRSQISREQEVERAREVARTRGIIARMWPRDDRPDLSPGGPRDHLAPRPRAGLAPIGYPGSISGGTLDRAVIKRRVKQHESQIDDCYLSAEIDRSSVGGRVSVRFLIEPDGGVEGSIGRGVDPAVASCVARVIRGIDFPAPRGGHAIVSYSFLFRPAGPP